MLGLTLTIKALMAGIRRATMKFIVEKKVGKGQR
jgi:hypothetical protein